MASECLLKIICDNNGYMDYDYVLEITSGMPEVSTLDSVLANGDVFTVAERNGTKKVIATSKIKLCKTPDCKNTCTDLHLCKFHLLGECSRRRCSYGHDLKSEHNSAVLLERQLQGLSKDQLRVLLLQSDTSLLPPVCASYNKGKGKFGNCDEKTCTRLHICENYIRGTCDGSTCTRSHDFHEPHPAGTLNRRGIPSQFIGSLPSIYANILAVKDYTSARGKNGAKNKESDQFCNRSKMPESMQRKAENMICLSFVKGYCKHGDKCWRVHFDMPYKWEVEVDQVWKDIVNNEEVEREYSNPTKMHSKETEPVCFETMTQGLHKVRRLSTDSSVLQPTFCLTTKWIWYWEDACRNWIQYRSDISNSITSEVLEQKYLLFLNENNNAVVQFSAGRHLYQLNFREMKQRNIRTGTERSVIRRPFFVSSSDVRLARSNKRGVHSSSHKGIPGFWDKSAVSDSGFQRVRLSPTHKDYIKVQEHFNKTMNDFSILYIERVQNKELWEDFQTKRERMKKANIDKKYGEGERLLFHGTRSVFIDAICLQNTDMRVSGTNGTVYGQGSYFAKDARYSHDYTDKYGEKSMFACRVLVGEYAKGQCSYRRPPEKNISGILYDSCVNDVRNPSIYVVFDRSQVYPEFLIKYDNKSPLTTHSGYTLGWSSSQSAILDTNPTIKPTVLSHVSQNNVAPESSVNITTSSPLHGQVQLTSSSGASEQPLLMSIYTARNHDNVFNSIEMSTSSLLPTTCPITDKTPTTSPDFANSEDVSSTNSAKCLSQLNLRGFQTEAAKALSKTAATLVLSEPSGKTDLGDMVPPVKAQAQTSVMQCLLHESSEKPLHSHNTTTERNPDNALNSREISSIHNLSDIIADKTPTSFPLFAKNEDVHFTNQTMYSAEPSLSMLNTEAVRELPKVKTDLSGNAIYSGSAKAQTTVLSNELHYKQPSTSSSGTSERALQAPIISRNPGFALLSREGSLGNFSTNPLSDLIPDKTPVFAKREDGQSTNSAMNSAKLRLGLQADAAKELPKAETLVLSKSEIVKSDLSCLGNTASAKAQTVDKVKLVTHQALPELRQDSQKTLPVSSHQADCLKNDFVTIITQDSQSQAVSSKPNYTPAAQYSASVKRISVPCDNTSALSSRQNPFIPESTHQRVRYRVTNTSTKSPKTQTQCAVI